MDYNAGMKRTLLTLGILAGCFLTAAAEPTAPYRYSAVKPGDTLEIVARRHAVTVEQVLELNPDLRRDPCLEFRTYVFVPIPQRARPKPRPAPAAEVASAAPVAAPPTVKAAPPVPVKAGSATELSEEEIEALYEDVVARHSTRVAAVIQPSLPSHQNVFIDASGRAMSIPAAAPPKPKVKEPEAPARHSLSSRRGLKTQEILRSSLKLLSVPYVWGGEDRSGVDCSGFVQLVFGWHGVHLPRTADLQYEVGRAIAAGKEQPGDLVFFETYCPGASHVGIFLGHRQFVHASSTAGVVTISNLDEARFQSCYLGAKRVW